MLKRSHKHYAEKYKHSLMGMAVAIAASSPARRKKVGCVIYLNDNNISYGFNAMPSGSDSEVCEDECGKTRQEVRHAEINSLDRLIYTSDEGKLEDAVAFVTLAPCLDCATQLAWYGISKVYYKEMYRCTEGISFLLEKGIEVEILEDK